MFDNNDIYPNDTSDIIDDFSEDITGNDLITGGDVTSRNEAEDDMDSHHRSFFRDIVFGGHLGCMSCFCSGYTDDGEGNNMCVCGHSYFEHRRAGD